MHYSVHTLNQTRQAIQANDYSKSSYTS